MSRSRRTSGTVATHAFFMHFYDTTFLWISIPIFDQVIFIILLLYRWRNDCVPLCIRFAIHTFAFGTKYLLKALIDLVIYSFLFTLCRLRTLNIFIGPFDLFYYYWQCNKFNYCICWRSTFAVHLHLSVFHTVKLAVNQLKR